MVHASRLPARDMSAPLQSGALSTFQACIDAYPSALCACNEVSVAQWVAPARQEEADGGELSGESSGEFGSDGLDPVEPRVLQRVWIVQVSPAEEELFFLCCWSRPAARSRGFELLAACWQSLHAIASQGMRLQTSLAWQSASDTSAMGSVRCRSSATEGRCTTPPTGGCSAQALTNCSFGRPCERLGWQRLLFLCRLFTGLLHRSQRPGSAAVASHAAQPRLLIACPWGKNRSGHGHGMSHTALG